jgi:flavin reductase (DIM6/NTAB) family NADH-FMN oxidoreductase RutF
MKTIDPNNFTNQEFYAYLVGTVAPRPIAFASTTDGAGHVNLSPFSFFNLFGANPPIVVFSPLLRMRDTTSKHTLQNVEKTREVVINIANYALVEQLSLASTEYPEGINEFIKAGLTPAPSTLVAPPRIQEAPVAMECKVTDIVALGDQGGAGNLIICQVLLLHLHENILDETGKTIDPHKLDAVARMGGDWYCRVTGESLFKLPKPLRNRGMGVDQIPEVIRNSPVLTGNNLGRLGNIEKMPSSEEVQQYRQQPLVAYYLTRHQSDPDEKVRQLHLLARKLLEAGKTEEAWKVLVISMRE